MKIPYIQPEIKVLNFREFCAEDDGPETTSFGTLAPKKELDTESDNAPEGYWNKFDWQD